ncbi:Protein RALF-like 4, partial [Mucuna pruriens]
MNSKGWIIFLVLALAMVAEASSKINKTSPIFSDGDLDLFDDNEFMMVSETHRRTLVYGQRQRYISYAALRKNHVPCGTRGQSYYNCNHRGRANPYRRGCS